MHICIYMYICIYLRLYIYIYIFIYPYKEFKNYMCVRRYTIASVPRARLGASDSISVSHTHTHRYEALSSVLARVESMCLSLTHTHTDLRPCHRYYL